MQGSARALAVIALSLALVACGSAMPELAPDASAPEPIEPTIPIPIPEPLPCCSEICFTLEDGTRWCVPIVWTDPPNRGI